ncbi:MAG: tetratricopeptide repeat protein [Chromatiales bacterium]
MNDYMTEEEKVEAIKEWWRENGRSVVAGVVLGLGGLFGWRGWVDYREGQAEAASLAYVEMRQAAQAGLTEAALAQGTSLREDYASTPYAALAALEAARIAVEDGDLATAETELRWAVDQARQDSVRELARLRLVRVLSAQGNYAAALGLLDSAPFSTAYEALVYELRGDIHRARGEREQAIEAYEQALATARGSTDYLRMKRDDLAVSAGADQG